MFPRPDPPKAQSQKIVHASSPPVVSAAVSEVASPDSPSLEREQSTTEFNATAFNIKPVSTVMKALAAGLFPRGATDVVELLLQTPLDRAAVGDLLGDGTPFCNELRQQYVSCFSFSSIDMLDALRKFMSAFKLPGEAQKIDRIVEAFAREFHKANPTVFSHQDTVHKLAFSVLMLNTDKHNKGIRKKDKMSCEGFIRNNRGLDEGKDLPRPYLASIYHRIEVVPLMETHGLSEAALAGSKISSLSSVITDPVKIRTLEKTLVAFSNPKSQSWLMKKGSKVLGWQRRWGLVNNKCMYLFLSPPSWGMEVSLKAVIPLDSVRFPRITSTILRVRLIFYQGVVCECIGTDSFVLKPDPRSERSRALKCAKINNGSLIPSNRTQYVFKVLDQYEQTQWFTAIDAEIREKKEPLSIDVLPIVISMDSISPSGLNEKSDAEALSVMLDSSLNPGRTARHRKGSLESSQLDLILNRKNSGKDSSSGREFGAGVAAEWHGMDIAADFVSSDIRRAQHRGKNRAFPVQNISVTRTPLDMGLVDHVRPAHSPELFKDDSILPLEDKVRFSTSRRGSADDIVNSGGRELRRGSADDIVVPSLNMRQKLVSSKHIKARSDWLNSEHTNHEGQVAVQDSNPQQSVQQQLQSLDEPHSDTAASSTDSEEWSLELAIAAVAEQLKVTKDTTSRLSRALGLIEEMKTRWSALLETELLRLDVLPIFRFFNNYRFHFAFYRNSFSFLSSYEHSSSFSAF
jgi:hypothetical protein